MEIATAAHLFISTFMFYTQIVRPRRYGLFVKKSVLAILLMVPGLVLLTCDKENKAQDAMGASIFAASCGFVGVFAAMIDLNLPWRKLIEYLALLYLSVGVSAIAALYRFVGGVGLDHWLFLAKSPLIVCMFFVRLPWNGRKVAISVMTCLHEIILGIAVGDAAESIMNRPPARQT
jgi:hypothetical protein